MAEALFSAYDRPYVLLHICLHVGQKCILRPRKHELFWSCSFHPSSIVLLQSRQESCLACRSGKDAAILKLADPFYHKICGPKNEHKLFLHRLFERTQGSGTSLENSWDIPVPPSKPKEDKLWREGTNF